MEAEGFGELWGSAGDDWAGVHLGAVWDVSDLGRWVNCSVEFDGRGVKGKTRAETEKRESRTAPSDC